MARSALPRDKLQAGEAALRGPSSTAGPAQGQLCAQLCGAGRGQQCERWPPSARAVRKGGLAVQPRICVLMWERVEGTEPSLSSGVRGG